MPAPKVSVIMPCYNVAAYVGEALQGAFSQTFTDFEVIVVNDGSPDTEELERAIAPWRNRILYIRRENGGVAAARNTALAAASGEWIAALDPDDSWKPAYLETQLRYAAAHPDADLIYGDAIIFGDVPEAGTRVSTFSPSTGEADFAALVEERCTVLHCSSIVRRTIVTQAGGFDESLHTGEDFDLWLRLASRGARIVHHGEALARYRRRAGSLISDSLRTANNYLRILDKASREYATTEFHHTAIIRQDRKLRHRIAVEQGKQSLQRGETEAALAAFEDAQALHPSSKLASLVRGLRVAPRLVRGGLYLRSLLFPSFGDSGSEGSLSRRSAWLLTAKMAGFALSIALPMLLARRLDKAEFGLYRQVFLIISTAIALLPLSMSVSAYYFVPREPARKGAVAANILLFLLAASSGAAGLLLGFPQIATWLTKEPGVASYVPAMAVLIVLWTAGSMMESMMLANEEVRLASLATVFVQTARTALLVTAALLLPNLGAVLAAAIVSGILQCVVVAGYLLIRFPGFWRRIDGPLLRRQLSYSIPLGLAGLLYTLQTDLANYFVSSRFGPAEFAIYSVGCFQIPLMNLLGEATAGVLIPQMTMLQQRGDTAEMIRLTLRALRKMALAAFPLFGFLLVVAPEFLTILYTDRYAASVPVFRINLVLIPLSILLTDPILRAYPAYRYHFLSVRIALFVLQFALLWKITATYGAWSAILAVVIIAVLERAVTAAFCARLTAFQTRRAGELLPSVGIAAAAAAAAAAAWALKSVMPESPKLVILASCASLYGLVYAGLLYWLRVLSPEELAFATRCMPAHWKDRIPVE